MTTPTPPSASWQKWLESVAKLWTDPQAGEKYAESIKTQGARKNFLAELDNASDYARSQNSLASASESAFYSRDAKSFSYAPRSSYIAGEANGLAPLAEEDALNDAFFETLTSEQADEIAEELAEQIRFNRAERLQRTASVGDEQALAAKANEPEKYKPTVAGCVPSRIVFCALIIVICMQQLAGACLPFGFSEVSWPGLPEAPLPSHPEKGDFFKSGAQEFTEIAELLQQAFPMRWQGAAAENYAGANSTFLATAQRLAELDRTMERYVNEQAAHVQQTQLALGIEQDALVATYLVVLWLERFPETVVMAFKRAVEISLSSVIACIALLGDCLDHSRRRADRATKLDYAEATRATQQPPGRLSGAVSGAVFDPNELHHLADGHEYVSAVAGSTITQTCHAFSKKIQDTHGAISGPSSNAFATKARQSKKAHEELQMTALIFSATLRSATLCYTQTDASAASVLKHQLHY